MIVKSLLNIAINQFEYVENKLSVIQDQDITESGNQKIRVQKEITQNQKNDLKLDFEYGNVSLFDAHQLLSILMRLEDQIWAAT